MRDFVGRLTLGAGGLAAGLFVGEVALRLRDGKGLLDARNWLVEVPQTRHRAVESEFDANLGWRPEEDAARGMFHHGRFGVRWTSTLPPDLGPGHIVAVGDSFTYGAEVIDWDAWPAHLERILGEPVVNGGVQGYGTDQIVLRGEQLAAELLPDTLLLGFFDGDLVRTRFAEYGGAPKPYFTIDGGRLVRHHDPVPKPGAGSEGSAPSAAAAARVLGRSYLASCVMLALWPSAWTELAGGGGYTAVDADPTEVTCRLLDRLAEASRTDIRRIAVVLLYGGQAFTNPDAPPVEPFRAIGRCAREAGLVVVDTWDEFGAVARADPAGFRSLYAMHGDEFGHLSTRGNRFVAELVARGMTGDASP